LSSTSFLPVKLSRRVVSDSHSFELSSVSRTFEAVGDFSLPQDIKENLLKLLLKRVELAGDPRKEDEEADDNLKETA
jgi:hypothetical protein